MNPSGKAEKKLTAGQYSLTDLLWLVAYFALLAAAAGGIVRGRSWAIATYDTSEATEQWQEWKSAATEMSKSPETVKRKPPKSDLPPAVVLMKDYFGICLVGGVGLTAVLLAAIMLMLRGALANSQPFVDRSSPEPKSATKH